MRVRRKASGVIPSAARNTRIRCGRSQKPVSAAICVADRLAILQNAYLSVISPEGCAAILWRDAAKAPQAAELLRLTPSELQQLGVVDDVLDEPLGGAHRHPKEMGDLLKAYIVRTLDSLMAQPVDRLVEKRYEKHRRIGYFLESENRKLVASGVAQPAP